MKILLADDDLVTREFLKTILESQGHLVTVAVNGLEALAFARKSPADMIISDIMMPKMDGFQLCREIKGDEQLRHIPFILCSGEYLDRQSKKLAEGLGVADFIAKPIRSGELLAIIDRIVEKSQQKNRHVAETPLTDDLALTKMYEDILTTKVQEQTRELEKNLQIQKIINKLLSLPLKDIPLSVLFTSFLEHICALPLFDVEPRGAFFLAHNTTKVLTLETHHNLEPMEAELCKQVPFGRCLCGQAAQTGQMVFADCLDERHENRLQGMKQHGHYCVPIISFTGEMLGVFTLFIREGTSHRQKVEKALKAAANGAASLITRKAAEEAEKRRGKQLRRFYRASNLLLDTKGSEHDVCQEVCHIVQTTYDLKMVWLGLIEPDHFEVRPFAISGEGDEYLNNINIRWDDSPEGNGPTGMAIKSLTPRLINDLESDPAYRPWHDSALKMGYRSSLATPLMTDECSVIGVLNYYSSEVDFFTENLVALLQAFANHAAVKLENVRIIQGLENRMKERTEKLEDALKRAKIANQAKSDFLANMSHELRTPMNAILGFSKLMVEGRAGSLNKQQIEYAEDIHDSGRHLLNLINDILDLSKIEAGKMTYEPCEFSLGDLLTGSLMMIRDNAMEHGITIQTDIDAEIGNITADRQKIKQVVYNLLSNAIKFTPDGGEVGVRALKNTDEILVEVWDTGIGIAPEDRKKLFKPFSQIESAWTKKYQGTGLGLILSKKFIELHGGMLQMESEPGKGSRFRFTLPFKRVQIDHKEIVDPQTKLLSFHPFLKHISRIISLCRRTGGQFGLCRLEFTDISDEEEVAQLVAAINNKVREYDLLTCYDDNTTNCLYMLVLNTNRQTLKDTAARIQNILQDSDFKSAIISYVLYPAGGANAEELLDKLAGKKYCISAKGND